MNTPDIQYQLIQHHGARRILIRFAYNKEWNERMRKVPGARWSSTLKGWHIPDTAENRKRCHLPAAIEATKVVSPSALPPTQVPAVKQPVISSSNRQQLKRMMEMLSLKKYSPSTQKTYRNEMLQLLQTLGNKPVEEMSANDLHRYMLYCTEKLKLSENTLHSRLNALKFYFEQVLGRAQFFQEIPRPKKQLQLPRHFNREEITGIIQAAGNIKHKTMLMIAYAAGLRVSEVVKLKVNDIDSERMCIYIRQAKGKKDRMVRLSPVLLVMLREYWKQVKPAKNGYLFPGMHANKPYSTRSLQLVLAAAKAKAGVMKPGGIHALRHSFATHLLDKGTDVTIIMKLLGHNSLKTTLRYLHITNRDLLHVLSPLDDLKL